MAFSSDSEDDNWCPGAKMRQRARILDQSGLDDDEDESFCSARSSSTTKSGKIDTHSNSSQNQASYCPASPSNENDASGDESHDVVKDSLSEGNLDGNSTEEIFESSLNYDDDRQPVSRPAEASSNTKNQTHPERQSESTQQNFFGQITSTPLNVSKKMITTHFDGLNVTAIPPEFKNLEVTAYARTKPDSNSSSSNSVSEDEGTPDDEEATTLNRSPNVDQGTSQFRGRNDSSGDDMLLRGLQNITIDAVASKSRFPFRKNAARQVEGARGLDSQDNIEEVEEDDDEVEEVSDDLSANFEFEGAAERQQLDSGNGDSDIQIVHEERRPQTSRSSEEVHYVSDFTDEDSGDLQVLTEKIKQIPLGKKQPAEKKAILLKTHELPPIRDPKAVPYNPSSAKNEDFFGDVRRTITKLAETIETMPMPTDAHDESDLPSMNVALYGHQIYGLKWLRWREQEFPGGGILADEMGLGKTIMILALILKSKNETSRADLKENWVDPDEIGSCIPSRTTLVVCPLSCIVQWEREVSSKAGAHNLSVTMFHGPQRTTSAARLAQSDIVLTTYNTIASEIPKDTDKKRRGRSPLERIYWYRVVLDEAHQIRNPKTVSAQAIYKLTARHRWAVTGTPVHNRPEDFFSMAKFLRMTPFDDPKVWDYWIGMKQVKKNQDARSRLHTLGKALILRRTKEELQASSKDNDANKIPPKIVEIIKIDMEEKEKEVYEHLMQYSKSLFKNFLQNKEQKQAELQAAAMAYTAERRKKKGEQPEEVGFTHLFALIVRLRQCAVLPYLIENMLPDEDEDSDLDDSAIRDEINLISRKNPMFEQSYLSSKLRKILEDLEELRQRTKATNGGQMEKVVIVSSWVKLLQILHSHLRIRKFSTVFITGQDPVQERTENMRKFNENSGHPQIVLLSLQAGAVGINLIGGNHVFFVEPHWNPQIELQAQDRVHRFGQKRNVHIRRYIVNSTIEDRILDLQQDKINLAEGILANTKTRSGGLNIAQMRKLFDL